MSTIPSSGILVADSPHPAPMGIAHRVRPHRRLGLVGDIGLATALLSLSSPPVSQRVYALTADSSDDYLPQINHSGRAGRPRMGLPYHVPLHVNPNAERHAAEKIAAAVAKRERRAARRAASCA